MDGYDVDVFVHSWWDESMGGKEYKKNSCKFEINSDEIFLELYKPKKYKFEKQIEFDISEYNEDRIGVCEDLKDLKKCAFNMKSSYYSIQQSHKLALEENENYDFYIRCRTDLAFPKKIKYEELNKNILYIGDGRYAGWDRFFSDWFACGSKENMDHYCSIYDKFDEFSKFGMPHMHELFRFYLQGREKMIKCDTYAIAPQIYYFSDNQKGKILRFPNLDALPKLHFFDR